MSAVLKEQGPPVAAGKRRLIEAALKLAARDGTQMTALGLRELAREAGLNHNTFYRHFENLDELGRAAAEEVATQLMAGMLEVRRSAARHADASRGAAEYFVEFVHRHPDPFVVGVRELHCKASPMRATLLGVVDRIAQESVVQIESLFLAPGIDRAALLRATTAITHAMLYRALDVIERPAERARICDELTEFMRAQFLGFQLAGQKPPR